MAQSRWQRCAGGEGYAYDCRLVASTSKSKLSPVREPARCKSRPPNHAAPTLCHLTSDNAVILNDTVTTEGLYYEYSGTAAMLAPDSPIPRAAAARPAVRLADNTAVATLTDATRCFGAVALTSSTHASSAAATIAAAAPPRAACCAAARAPAAPKARSC